MKLSHSKLNTLISNPKRYKAIYKVGLTPKEKTSALSIGSAVHWGIEHGTDNLQEYFAENGTFFQAQQYTQDQLLAESMVYGYLKNKDKIFADILRDFDTGEQLELLDESHEVNISCQLPSRKCKEAHEFVGIIDLLLLTPKGFIIIDFKTSRMKPEFNKYLEQIYRYIFLLRNAFPDVPIYKLGIINLRKASIRQKRDENEYAFLRRLKMEYELNEDEYINCFIYTEDTLDENLVKSYIDNLTDMADYSEYVDNNKLFWWNYADPWGKDYYNICHGVKDSWFGFDVKDVVYDETDKELKKIRPAKEVDMLAINQDNVLNKFEQFETQAIAYFAITNDTDKDKFLAHLSKNFIVDKELLETHWSTLLVKIQQYPTEDINEEVDEEKPEDE